MTCVVCNNKRKEFEEKEKEWEEKDREGFMRGICDVHHYLIFGETSICFYCVEDLLKFVIELFKEAKDYGKMPGVS